MFIDNGFMPDQAFVEWLAKKKYVLQHTGVKNHHKLYLDGQGASGERFGKSDPQKAQDRGESRPFLLLATSLLGGSVVVVPKEGKRFHVAIRRGAQGFKLQADRRQSRKLRVAVEKAGEGAWHQFDYDAQDAIIFAPAQTIPLNEWQAGTSTPVYDPSIKAPEYGPES